jgi:VWFA-related protein
MSSLRMLLALILLSFAIASLQAQSAPPQSGDSGIKIKTTVQRVLVDVVVTNDRGEPIKGLREKDFEVLEDGKPQKIATFEEHQGVAQSEIKLPPMPAHVYTNFPITKAADAINVILLDALNTQKRDQSYVHSQMFKYLKTISPGARVAIFTLSSRLRMIQGVTNDSVELLAAIHTAEAQVHSSGVVTSEQEAEELHHFLDFLTASQAGQKTPSSNQLASGALDSVNALKEFLMEANTFQTAVRVDMTLDAFQQLARYLSSVPGRKNVIWFSGSFPAIISPSEEMPNPFGAVADFERQIRKTVDILAAGQVALYPVRANGLDSDPLFEANGEEISTVRPSVEGQNDQLRAGNLERNLNQETMEELAKETGGKAYYNGNNLGDVLTRVMRNGTQYYSLTYGPRNSAMDGKYRKIRVELRERKGKANLAYRRGYYADNLGAIFAAVKPNADPLLPLVGRNMPDYSEILYKVLVEPVTPQPAADAPHIGSNPDLKGPVTRYGVDFAIALSDLKLEAASDGTRHGNIEIVLVAYDREGKPLNMFKTTGVLALKPNEYAALQKGGLQIQEKIDVPAGYAYLRTGVYDVRSGAAGTLGIPLADDTGQSAR